MALTLRVVGGLSSEEIARAFLVPVPTVQARITRAKKTIAAAWVPFELPRPASAVSAAVPTTTSNAQNLWISLVRAYPPERSFRRSLSRPTLARRLGGHAHAYRS